MSDADTMPRRIHRLVTWPISHPWTILGIAADLALLAVFFASRLRPNGSLAAMFPAHDPAADALVHILNDFPAADQLIILASLPPNASAPDPQRLINFGKRFSDLVRANPDVERLTNGVFDMPDRDTRAFVEKVIAPSAIFYLDEPTFEAARKRLTPDEMRRQLERDRTILAAPGPGAALAELAKTDPLGLHEFLSNRLATERPFRTYQNGDAFISPDGRSLMIRVIGRQSPDNLDYSRLLTDSVAHLAERANTDGLRLEYTGSYPIAARSCASHSAQHDREHHRIGSAPSGAVSSGVSQPVQVVRTRLRPGGAGNPVRLRRGRLDFAKSHAPDGGARRDSRGNGDRLFDSISLILREPPDARQHRGAGREGNGQANDSRRTGGVGDVRNRLHRHRVLHRAGAAGVRAARNTGAHRRVFCAVIILPAILMLTDRRPTPAISRLRFGVERSLVAIGRQRQLWLALSGVTAIAAIVLITFVRGDILPLESDLTVMHPRPNPAIDAEYHVAQQFGVSPSSLMVYLRADDPNRLIERSYDVSGRLKNVTDVTASIGLADLLPDPRTVPARIKEISQLDPDQIVADFRRACDEAGFSPDAFQSYSNFLHVLLAQRHAPDISDLLRYPRLAETMLPATRSRPAGRTKRLRLCSSMSRSIRIGPAATRQLLSCATRWRESTARPSRDWGSSGTMPSRPFTASCRV